MKLLWKSVTGVSISLLMIVLYVVSAAEDDSTDACAFDKPRYGEIVYGYNTGGCFRCIKDDGSNNGEDLLLSGEELIKECQQMCTSDPQCIAYEVAYPEIVPFYGSTIDGDDGANCCIERSLPSDSSFYIKADGSSLDNNNSCEKQASCWTRIEKKLESSSSCPVTESSPKCYQTYEWEDDHEQSILEHISQGCPVGSDVYGADFPAYQSLLDTVSPKCMEENQLTNNNQDSCNATFNEPRYGEITYGYNTGGCFSCEDDNGMVLTGDELMKECEQMCTSNPECLAYEVSYPDEIDPFYALVMGEAYKHQNCCVEISLPSNSAFFVTGGSNNNCQKEGSCWSRIEKTTMPSSTTDCSDDATVTEPSPKCRQTYTWNDDDEQVVLDLISQGCRWDDTAVQSLLDKAYPQCRRTNQKNMNPPPAPTSSTRTSNAARCSMPPFQFPLVGVFFMALP